MVANDNGSGFSIHDVKCPSCNGQLELPPNAETVKCPFCGNTIRVSYGEDTAPSGVEADGTIRDRGTGMGLFRARVAPGWQVVGTALQSTGSSSRPHIPQVALQNRAGSSITLATGNAGTRRSTGMEALTVMYGSHLAGVDRTNYADVPDPMALADMAVSQAVSSMGATSLQVERQMACPDLEARKQRSYTTWQRFAQVQNGIIGNPFMGVILKTYAFSCNGQPWKAASYVTLSAVKDGMNLDAGFGALAEGFSGLMDGIGNLFSSMGASANANAGSGAGASQQASTAGNAVDFLMGGGFIGKMKRDRAAAQAQAAQPQPQRQDQPVRTTQPAQPHIQTQAQAQPQQASWCSPDYAEYVSGGTIYWSVEAIATFVAPAADFDTQFEAAFLPLVNSLEMHPDVENLAMQVAAQQAAQVGQATQTQLAQNQAAFQAQQAAHRQQQAAFDAYNQSITDARNAHHQQFMASSHAQMDRSAPDYSEAIRGVNTYTTSDGREVELSVHADRAYENQAGDVIGASGSFDPGANWTEIPRT